MLDFPAEPKGDMEPLRPTSVVRFGTYEVSFQSGEVRKAGYENQSAAATDETAGDPCWSVRGKSSAREELRGRVWTNESFGDFDQALNIAIAKLRSALGGLG